MPNIRIGTTISRWSRVPDAVQPRARLEGWSHRTGKCYSDTIRWLAAGNIAMTDDPSPLATAQSLPERKPLSPAARRALAEAEARRAAAEADARPVAQEFQGPKGPEPTRYGDWENKGIASDF
jgi:hypothetical protein